MEKFHLTYLVENLNIDEEFSFDNVLFSRCSDSQTLIDIKNLKAENINIAKLQGQECVESIINSISFIFKRKIPFKLIRISDDIQLLEINAYVDATIPCQFNNSLIPDFKKYINFADNNETIKWIFELINREEPFTWTNMYRIYEVIYNDTNKRKSQIINKKEANRFKQTSNNPKHTGKHSRHGFSNCEPTTNPMSQKEAKTFIENLIKKYIDLKF